MSSDSYTNQIFEEQDEKIEEIGKAVKRIKPMTNLMADEIEKQKK